MIYCTQNKLGNVKENFVKNLDRVYDWCASNRLKMDSSKTKVIYILSQYIMRGVVESPLND